MLRIYEALGGRKQTNGYLAVALITAYAFTKDVSFIEYSGALLVALGVTTAATAAVDRAQVKASATVDLAEAERRTAAEARCPDPLEDGRLA